MEYLGLNNIGLMVKAKHITDAWPKVCEVIMERGEISYDSPLQKIAEDGSSYTINLPPIKEVLDLSSFISEPLRNRINPKYFMDGEMLEEYVEKEILSALNLGFEYTYGERINGWAAVPSSQTIDGMMASTGVRAVNQLENCIQRLTNDPNTRHAVITTWIPSIDSKRDFVPCLISMIFRIFKKRLYEVDLFRSHDFGGAYPANLYAMSKVLEIICDETGYKPGGILTHSVSAHIYQRDWPFILGELLNQPNVVKSQYPVWGLP